MRIENMCWVIKGEGLMTGPCRRWCILGRRLAVWEMPYFTIEFISIYHKENNKDWLQQKSPAQILSLRTRCLLWKHLAGVSVGLLLSPGQFRISLCLCLACIPGERSVSGIQAGKSVRSGRWATARWPRGARRLGRAARCGHRASCRPKAPISVKPVRTSADRAEQAVRKLWFNTCLL